MRNFFLPYGLRPRKRVENPYADMLSRSVAAAIDIFVLFFILYDFFYWMDQRYFPHIGADFLDRLDATTDIQARATLITDWIWRCIVQLFFFGVVIVGSQIFTGTTPGKWLVGLKIVRAKTHERVSAWRFVLRYLAYIPACAPLMVGMFWMSFNKERRGWHDYIADTAVLNLRPDSWYWNHLKNGFLYLKNKIKPSAPLEKPVGEPAAEQRHDNSEPPIR